MKPLKETIQQYAQEAYDLRDSIHREPELAFEEVLTHQKIKDFLDRHHISYVAPIAKTGILATIVGQYPGPTVLLRADMDALPIQEDLSVYNASTIPNKMHACGHDGHSAGLCLSAAVLQDLKDDIHGTIKFLFQPAEEHLGGALPMIEAGVLEGVDMAFGAHLWGFGVEGTAATKSGPFMASPDNFKLVIKGKGGHGSKPQVSVDPIVIAAQIILGIQTVVSRQTDPFETLVVSFGKIQGGSATNIIPEEVVLEGTIRSLDETLRKETPLKMEKIAQGIAQAYGANLDFIYDPQYPVLVNDEAATQISLKVLKEFLGENQVLELKRADMGGEDFAYIAQRVPSNFMYIGIAKDSDHLISHHHCNFNFDNKNISVISEALIRCALEATKQP